MDKKYQLNEIVDGAAVNILNGTLEEITAKIEELGEGEEPAPAAPAPAGEGAPA